MVVVIGFSYTVLVVVAENELPRGYVLSQSSSRPLVVQDDLLCQLGKLPRKVPSPFHDPGNW
jgi:hypothetical protein